MSDIIKNSIYSSKEFVTDKVLFKYQIITVSENDFECFNITNEENKIIKLLEELERDVQLHLNENPSMEPHDGLVMVPLTGNKRRFYQALKQKNNYNTSLSNNYQPGNYKIELLKFNSRMIETETLTEHDYRDYDPIGSLISMNEGKFIAQAFYQENYTNYGGKKYKKNKKTRKKHF